jgi:hypothetical protein
MKNNELELARQNVWTQVLYTRGVLWEADAALAAFDGHFVSRPGKPMLTSNGDVPVLSPTGRPVHLPRAGLRFTEAEVMGSIGGAVCSQTNVLAHIKVNPGLRSEQIAKNLGLKPKDVSKVLKALREEKRVSVKGKRRGTMYTAR